MARVIDSHTGRTMLTHAPPLVSLPLQIIPIDLESELQTSFMQYAMSIILGRALPDVRDGLKPVHRRILYAMHGLGLQPEGGYRKCARVVGEVRAAASSVAHFADLTWCFRSC